MRGLTTNDVGTCLANAGESQIGVSKGPNTEHEGPSLFFRSTILLVDSK